MANIKSNGWVFDGGLIVETGVTITAGSLVWADISGTNVVHTVRAYSGVTPENGAVLTGRGIVSLDTTLGVNTGVFLGVMVKTQTGQAWPQGSQTGVSWYTDGVFQFNTTLTAASKVLVGHPVFAVDKDTVRCALSGINATPTNSTGVNPIGIVSFIAGSGVANTASNGRVYVKLFPHRTMQAFA